MLLGKYFFKVDLVMRLSLKSWVFGIMLFIWILKTNRCSKDLNTCTFFYWRVDWSTAMKTCERNNKFLLCYKTKKEIDDITEAFRLSAFGEAELELWLSSRNCSRHDQQEECLSLHIQKTHKRMFHYFQTQCKNRFPFVCCLKEEVTWTTGTSTRELSSTAPTQCKGLKRRGLIWPDTPFGDTAVLDCPGNSVGEATWSCSKDGSGDWDERGPDLKSCKSQDIIDLKENLNTSSARDALSLIGSTFDDEEREIFGGDLVDVLAVLRLLPDRLSDELEEETPSQRWTLARDFAETSSSVIDRIIELPDTWKDIEKKRRPLVATDLLSSVEGFGALLANSMTEDFKEENLVGKNMALQVLQTTFGESLQLPTLSVTSHYSRRGHIILDEGYDKNLDVSRGNISVVFTLYTNLKTILEPQISEESVLNSAVLSASVIQRRRDVPISGSVRILVEHISHSPNNTACVFWNQEMSRWDTDGCQLEGSNGSYSLCVCNHLTNFAVLMDFHGVMDEVDQLPFFYITVIGCSLSIVCLAICIFVFTCYSFYSKHSWGLRYAIHRNLSLTLLIANLVLVLGLDKTDNQRVCAVLAGVLHYFFLSAFSWMLLEGIHIYMLLVVVFAARRSHWEKYYLFGYGFPMIIVAITAISRPMYYGTDEVCWLSIEKGTIWAFMGPVACILSVNIAALILAQYKASNISVKTDKVALVKRWLRITLILFPVLGITWVFGFLYVSRRFVVAGYLFAIFNSLQGFCIFVCHCLMDKKARNSVLESFKKKTASVESGSTGVAKKHIDSKETDPKVSSDLNQFRDKVEDMSKLFSFRDNVARCRMPWSFCFEVSPGRDEETPRLFLLLWKDLRDRIS